MSCLDCEQREGWFLGGRPRWRVGVLMVVWCVGVGIREGVVWGAGEEEVRVLGVARGALGRGAALVAEGQLRGLLREGTLSEASRREASVLLAQACLALEEAERVEGLLQPWRGEPEAQYWLGKAALACGQWGEAERFLAGAAQGGKDEVDCALGRAEALSRLGRSAEALGVLEPLFLKAESQVGSLAQRLRVAVVGLLLDMGEEAKAREAWRGLRPATALERQIQRYLEARIWLVQGRWEEAAAQFGAFLGIGRVGQEGERAEGIPFSVYEGAALGRAEALSKGGQVKEALRVLAGVLEEGRLGNVTESVLQRYVAMRRELKEGEKGGDSELRGWTQKGSFRQKGAALFYLAQDCLERGQVREATDVLERFGEEYREHAMASQAMLQRAELAMAEGDWRGAEERLRNAVGRCREERLKGQVEWKRGVCLLQLGRDAEALEVFEGVLKRAQEVGVEEVAVKYHEGVAALRLGRMERVEGVVRRLKALPGTEVLVAELDLQRFLAGLRQPGAEAGDAEKAYADFAQRYPGYPRLGEARVALAEWCWGASLREPEREQAQRWRRKAEAHLAQVVHEAPSERASEQGDYLAVFLAEESAGVIERGEAFLKAHPASALEAEVRMKLGEAYMRRGDYLHAEQHFTWVEGADQRGFSESAAYLAGQCAAELLNPGSVDRALSHWNRVVEQKGALAFDARYQQATLKSRMGEEGDAVRLYDEILQAVGGEELRWRAWCGKADALVSMARRQGEPLEGALAEYLRLARSAGVPLVWRNQALFKVGKVLSSQDVVEAVRYFAAVGGGAAGDEDGV